MSQITIVQGHPDRRGGHYCHALADAYADGARQHGHETRRVETAQLEFPLLESQDDYESGQTPESLLVAQSDLLWADHYVIVYPLWLGTLPAKLKGFLEQVFRPGVAYRQSESGQTWTTLLKGKSARIIVTMGMPALAYRWYFGAHGLKNLERNILGFVGVKPIRATLIGMVESMSDEKRKIWIDRVERLGSRAE
jgi:putative NADPH-quinone reductase